MCNGVANKFHKVKVLHSETLVFVTTAIVATVAEVESGSTFPETEKISDKLTILHGVTSAEMPLHTSFSSKFQPVTVALVNHVIPSCLDCIFLTSVTVYLAN